MNGEQIEERLYGLVSLYADELGLKGSVFYRDLRPLPKNASAYGEDAVVAFLSGTGGDIQSGSCVVNVYVPDLTGAQSGVYMKDKVRCAEIASALERFASFANLNDPDLYFRQSDVIYTFAEEAIRQHYVSLRLDFRAVNTNY